MRAPSTARRAAIAIAACMAGSALAPAVGQAATPTIGCKFGAKALRWNYAPSLTHSAVFAASEAATAWSNSTNVDFVISSNYPNVVVNAIDLQGWPFYRDAKSVGLASYPSCSGGIWQGQVQIYLDNEYYARASYDMLRQVMSHEFGHALGLGHNDATSGTCANGRARPISIMSSIAETTLAGVCGPLFPAAEDITAINSLYK